MSNVTGSYTRIQNVQVSTGGPASADNVAISLPIAPVVYSVTGVSPDPAGTYNLFIYVDSSSCNASGTDSASNPICGNASGGMIYISGVVMNSAAAVYITLYDGTC